MKEVKQDTKKIVWALTQINNAITILDREGNIEWVNRGFENLFGSSLAEVKNKNVSELKRKDIRKNETIKYFIKTFIQKKIFNYESIIINKQGEECWVYTTITPIMDETDNLIGIVIVDTDISEKKKTEQEHTKAKKVPKTVSSKKQRTPSQEKTLKNKKILLVEDEILNQMVTKHLLENEFGATVETAENGKTAIAMIQKTVFDLVIMDIQMPEMNGYDTTSYIRTKLPAPQNKIPVMAMTAHAFKDEEVKYKEAGMNSFITKPIKMEELKQKLKHILT